MIKGVILDLDGTTLYTLEDLKDSLNTVLKNNNFPTKTIEEVKQAVGRGSKKLIIDSLPVDTSQEVVEKIFKEYTNTYFNNCANKTRPYEGIKELLDKLEEKGVLLSVNSNKYDELTNELVHKYFPTNNFKKIIGSREGIPNKPDPYSANELVQIMGLNKDEVLYIGDSEADYKTSQNANLKFIGCAWGFRGRDKLQEIGVENIVDKPEDILIHI